MLFSVESRARLIYVLDISFPSLKIIYIISAIIGLRRRHTNTFYINIEGLKGDFTFPSTFSICAKSGAQADVIHVAPIPAPLTGG